MPYLNGEEVLAELNLIAPSAKVLLSSQWKPSNGSPAKGWRVFCRKPYSALALAETVKGILDDENRAVIYAHATQSGAVASQSDQFQSARGTMKGASRSASSCEA
jgi:hypothetical protein